MSAYGLIGYPLGHSFSKKYFTEKFEKEGLNDSYELFPIRSADEIHPLLRSNPDLRGLNVTIPYKQTILSQIDDLSNIPEGLKACNCIRIRDGKTYAYNTDIIGFERSLISVLKPYHKRALILGNGGAAEAVKFVCNKLGIKYYIVSRSIHDGSDFTYADLDDEIIRVHLIIINTTPLGMYPTVDTCPDIPYHILGKDHILFDLVYNPETTLFMKNGADHRATVMNGLEMLKIQAEESWKIWKEVYSL